MSKGILYSLAFSKLRDAAFFSHLDTLRLLDRAVRRTGLGVCYTQGCNPHIRLSLLRALPVGIESEGEWFSLRLLEPEDPEECRRRLNLQLPKDFRIVQAQEGPPPAIRENRCELVLYFEGPMAAAAAAAARFMDREKIEVQGTKKGRTYRYDVRPLIRGCAVEDGVIRFRIEGKPDAGLRLGDLVKAVQALPGEEPLRIETIRVIQSSFEKPDES